MSTRGLLCQGAIQSACWPSIMRTSSSSSSSSSNQNVTCSRYDISEKLLIFALNENHSLKTGAVYDAGQLRFFLTTWSCSSSHVGRCESFTI